MFKDDNPIKTSAEDLLNRSRFIKNLSDAILSWNKEESIVIALNGVWGSGKTSIINLLKERILKSSVELTVIDYNPWFFSGQEKFIERYFTEISNYLSQKNDDKDKVIAEKLRLYAKFLSIAPTEKEYSNAIYTILIILGILGISFSGIATSEYTKYGMIALSGILIVAKQVMYILNRVADFYSYRSSINQKSNLQHREEISDLLKSRKHKLLIIVDDIDRLTSDEISQLFRLMKISTEFPNIIMLLSYDKKIVKDALENNYEVRFTHNYIDKIVQVSFDIPDVSIDKVYKFLTDELDLCLFYERPDDFKMTFEEVYWSNIFQSGIRVYFNTIRDVKRFINSLKFNLNLVVNDSVMEVNPVDFIAIEALRIFEPELHNFIKNNKYTFTHNIFGSNQDWSANRDIVNQFIDNEASRHSESLKALIKYMFPTLEGSYGKEWQANWNKSQRICSSDIFDMYFTLVPGGDEGSISQFEIENFLRNTKDRAKLESILKGFILNNKISEFLLRLQDYTDDTFMNEDDIENVIVALYNISDSLRVDGDGMFGTSDSFQVCRITYQLLSRLQVDSATRISRNAILQSEGLIGPVQDVSLIEDKDDSKQFIDKEVIHELKKICLKKIVDRKNDLLKLPAAPYLLYRWKDWVEDNSLREFIRENIETDDKLLQLLKALIAVKHVQCVNDFRSRQVRYLENSVVRDFLKEEEISGIEVRLRNLSNTDLSEDDKEVVELYFKTDNV